MNYKPGDKVVVVKRHKSNLRPDLLHKVLIVVRIEDEFRGHKNALVLAVGHLCDSHTGYALVDEVVPAEIYESPLMKVLDEV